MSSEEKRFKFNNLSKNVNVAAIFNIMSPIIVQGINFFALPYFTSVMGPENYGMYSVYHTWMSIMTVIVGLQVHGTIGTAFMHFPENERLKYQSSVISISLVSFLLTSIFFILFSSPISNRIQIKAFLFPLLLLQAFGNFLISFANSIYSFTKQAHKNFILSFILSISVLILSYYFLTIKNIEHLYIGKILGDAIPYTIIGLVVIILSFWKGKTAWNRKYWIFCLPMCIPLVFHGLSHIILGQGGRLVLQKYVDEVSVGIFSLSTTFVSVLSIVNNALNITWVPVYYELLKDSNKYSIKTRSNNYIMLFTCLTTGFLLIYPEVFRLFVSSEFYSAIEIIPILAVGQFFSFLYTLPVNYEFYHKNTKWVAVGTLTSAAINIIFSFFTVKILGIFGVAIASLVSYFLLFIFHNKIAKKIGNGAYPFEFKFYLKYILIILASATLQYVFYEQCLIRWILACFTGCFIIYRTLKNKMIF